MSTIAIIPARGGSKGIPRKNVLPLCGKPLLAWTIEAASSARFISTVYVTTDDPEIAAVAEKYGAAVIWRPAEIAGDAATSESALIHAVDEVKRRETGGDCVAEGGRLEIGDRRLEGGGQESESKIQLQRSPQSGNDRAFHPKSQIAAPWHPDDVLVFLQCTSPLTTAADIDALVGKLIAENADSALSATPFDFFLWKEEEENAIGINHDKRFRQRRQDRDPQFVENGAIYAMRMPGFLEARHRFFGKTVFHVMPRERCWEIDEPVDFEIAELLLRKRLQTDKMALLPEEVSAVVFDFDGVLTDDRVVTSQNGSEAVFCTRADGMGIRHLREAGIPVLILSSEENPVVRARAAKLKVEVIHGSLEKGPRLAEWAADKGIDLANCIYVGNDVNDVGPMKIVGCPVAVADAHPQAKRHALILLNHAGGTGAAREVSELILRAESYNRVNSVNPVQ